MHPILFSIAGMPIRAWGVMVSLGIVAGVTLSCYRGNKVGLKADQIIDFAVYAVIGGFLGARVWEVVFSWNNYADNWVNALKFWDGGLSIQGAVVGGLLVAWWFIKKHNINFGQFADVLAPGLILGQAIGRIGCFLNGDAYGIPTKSWLGVVYHVGTPAYAAYGPVPLVPAELMEGAGDLCILVILLFLGTRKFKDGTVGLAYFVLYGLLRFTLEFWRGDSLTLWPEVKAAQVMSLSIAGFCILTMWWLNRKSESKSRIP